VQMGLTIDVHMCSVHKNHFEGGRHQ
jgi:hypothetical protein